MESFLVAVRVVMPMALMMLVGVIMRLTKVADRDTMKKIDKMIFKVFMPMLMFYNIYNTDFAELDGSGYLVYGTVGLVILFLAGVFVVPRFIKRRDTAASMAQALLRSNYLLFGAAIAQNIYGAGNIGAVMLLGAIAVPAFNAMSAVLLEIARSGKAKVGNLLKSIITNPTVVAAILGLLVNFSGLKMPELIEGVVQDVSGLSTPLSFLSLGVSLNVATISGNKKILFTGIAFRLVIIPAIFLGGAMALGISGVPMCALLILFAAPTAVSSYPMAVAMDADGELAGQMVVFSTLCALATIFCWIMLLNGMGLL